MDSKDTFNWKLFFKRTCGVYVIGALWIRESAMKHDRAGLVWAIAGSVVVVAGAYFWTLSSHE